MSKYTINVSFQTRVNKTTRTLEIAESFGLGLDEKEWTLYDNLELEVKRAMWCTSPANPVPVNPLCCASCNAR